ncbi:MarR family transcriptional regulator [Streptomyces sp. ICBB 8177]|uniref:MarR family winged helix-turn-helix transcriptional regulator n=1 Tax=Streptomyces sp. ICBB 8177 TaxID=563922 RepID=UPI000D67C04C|nr:MarR family transcriptional regulator [Streptomyces sp. ICBB 8177]PWI42867.1 MarR family transcriptional regulator [Streptomyces sp. ICBB 8177]
MTAATDPTPSASSAVKSRLLDLMVALGTAHWKDYAATAAQHGLTSVQARLLAQVTEPVPMRGLAEQLGCDASNVTGVVDRLQARGLVLRESDARDRRVKNVVATAEGLATIQRIRAEMQATHTALDSLTEDERATLYTLLERLRPGLENRD